MSRHKIKILLLEFAKIKRYIGDKSKEKAEIAKKTKQLNIQNHLIPGNYKRIKVTVNVSILIKSLSSTFLMPLEKGRFPCLHYKFIQKLSPEEIKYYKSSAI